MSSIPEKKKKTRKNTIEMDSDIPPSLDALNSAALFQRRIKFTWLRRRGELIEAGFDGTARIAQWFEATDLRTFTRSQDILFYATDFLIPTPPRRVAVEVWEPVAQLIRNVANLDAVDSEPALKEEFESIIRSTWNKARRPYANDGDILFEILKECQTTRRNPDAEFPHRSCVWAGGMGESAPHFCWVYQENLIDWLSTPSAKHKQYQWHTVRRALQMLGFKSDPIHLRRNGDQVWVRVWRGPIDLLADDDTRSQSVID